MTTITVLPTLPPETTGYRALSGDSAGTGSTVGEAIDALSARVGLPAETTLVVVQPMQPDVYFTAEQRARLGELMSEWRSARDTGTALAPEAQAELDALIRAEVQAAGERAAALLRQVAP